MDIMYATVGRHEVLKKLRNQKTLAVAGCASDAAYHSQKGHIGTPTIPANRVFRLFSTHRAKKMRKKL